MQINLNALQQRDARGPALKRFEEIARWLTSNMSATAEDGVQWLQRLTQDLSIPRLGRWGIAPNDFAAIIEKAAVASSMKGNPIQLDDADLRTVLEAVI